MQENISHFISQPAAYISSLLMFHACLWYFLYQAEI